MVYKPTSIRGEHKDYDTYYGFGPVMLFTGFKDDNEVEIYEGDILLITYCGDDVSHQAVIKYDGNALCINAKGRDYDCTTVVWAFENWGIEHVKVIGNIYENKGLLE